MVSGLPHHTEVVDAVPRDQPEPGAAGGLSLQVSPCVSQDKSLLKRISPCLSQDKSLLEQVSPSR